MRLLIGVVHFWEAGDGRHGSLSPDPSPRVRALRQLILQLHRLFGSAAASLNHMARRIDLIDDQAGSIDIRLCVVHDRHVLPDLGDLEGLFDVEICSPESPRLLGFCCQAMLRDVSAQAVASGQPYDFVGYLEDDIIIYDPDFFLKLSAFSRAFGNHYLLMPNRIETMSASGQLSRFYIDGDYNPEASKSYRSSAEHKLCMNHLGQIVCFDQPLNLHSGCFFLNQSQALEYFSNPEACSMDISFHGPLESAATLGVLKAFELMKPALSNGRFLTVEHAGCNFMGLVPRLS